MVAEEAMNLSASGRELLLEKLLASLAGEANPAVERAHLEDVRERRAAVRSGKSRLVEGQKQAGLPETQCVVQGACVI